MSVSRASRSSSSSSSSHAAASSVPVAAAAAAVRPPSPTASVSSVSTLASLPPDTDGTHIDAQMRQWHRQIKSNYTQLQVLHEQHLQWVHQVAALMQSMYGIVYDMATTQADQYRQQPAPVQTTDFSKLFLNGRHYTISRSTNPSTVNTPRANRSAAQEQQQQQHHQQPDAHGAADAGDDVDADAHDADDADANATAVHDHEPAPRAHLQPKRDVTSAASIASTPQTPQQQRQQPRQPQQQPRVVSTSAAAAPSPARAPQPAKLTRELPVYPPLEEVTDEPPSYLQYTDDEDIFHLGLVPSQHASTRPSPARAAPAAPAAPTASGFKRRLPLRHVPTSHHAEYDAYEYA